MTHDDIVNLAKLVKIRVSETESLELIPNMESVLGYIDQIQSVVIEDTESDTLPGNPELRQDSVLDATFDFMSNVPYTENGYVQVPKVLGGE